MSGYIVDKKLLRVQHVVGEKTTQITTSDRVEFPRHVKEITETDARVKKINATVFEDEVLIEGIITKQIYYVEEYTEAMYELSVEHSFSERVEIKGVTRGMEAQIDGRVKGVSYQRIDKHNYTETVTLEIMVKVTETEQLEVVTDVTHPQAKLRVKKELLKVDSVVGEDSVETTVVAAVDFEHPVKKIKDTYIQVEDISASVQDDQVVVAGTIHSQIFYVGQETGRLYEQSVKKPFKATVHIPGAKPGMKAWAEANVLSVDYELEADNDEAEQTVVLEVFAKVMEELQAEVVTDVMGVPVQKELLKVDKVVAEKEKTVTVKNEVDCFNKPVKKIVNTDTAIEIDWSETEVKKDKVMVVGELKKRITYVSSEDNAVYSNSVKERFTASLEMPGVQPGMKAQVHAEVRDINYQWDAGAYEVEQEAVLSLAVKVTQAEQLEVVVGVGVEEECPADDGERPTFIMYKLKPGDTFWELARRYKVTVEEIQQANPGLDPHNLPVGEFIKIPCPKVPGAKG
ncbi:SPOCS domain-containing protein [Calderihabitans maritimus]|uniref:Peptidoglycan-binding LysM n=1 Tax=Calderihabitans maritimus TaxID=1246530 RepID=A0A1Z5HQ29_9FIRM|nr:SPOCS domain-containing protein [Calderihabitans maritimus]GAW91639.1 Peptidoglycan-binding LysM [Calderihabitans maritimus]